MNVAQTPDRVRLVNRKSILDSMVAAVSGAFARVAHLTSGSNPWKAVDHRRGARRTEIVNKVRKSLFN